MPYPAKLARPKRARRAHRRVQQERQLPVIPEEELVRPYLLEPLHQYDPDYIGPPAVAHG